MFIPATTTLVCWSISRLIAMLMFLLPLPTSLITYLLASCLLLLSIIFHVLNTRITLFMSITMFSGTDSILCGIFPIFSLNMGIFHIILSVPQDIVMDLNYVTRGYFVPLFKPIS